MRSNSGVRAPAKKHSRKKSEAEKTNGPIFEPKRALRGSRMPENSNDRERERDAPRSILETSTVPSLLSASRPPHKYPSESATSTVNIWAVQTNMWDPNAGASRRLPVISSTRMAAPIRNARSSIENGVKAADAVFCKKAFCRGLFFVGFSICILQKIHKKHGKNHRRGNGSSILVL